MLGVLLSSPSNATHADRSRADCVLHSGLWCHLPAEGATPDPALLAPWPASHPPPHPYSPRHSRPFKGAGAGILGGSLGSPRALTHPVPTETVRLPSGIHRRPGCKRPPRALRHRQAGCVSGSWGLSGTGGRVEQTLCHLVESLSEVALMSWRPPWPCAQGEPCPSVLSACSPTTLERGRFQW